MAGRPPAQLADGKARLLAACRSILTEEESESRLTIAAVCERAGCTPPTLYHHFGSLERLAREASLAEYEHFVSDFLDRPSTAICPRERMLETGRAYVEWAVEHPIVYLHLMGTPNAPEMDAADASLLESRATSLLAVDIAKSAGLEPSHPRVDDLVMARMAAWNGVANLAVASPTVSDDALDRLLEIVTDPCIEHHFEIREAG